MVSDNDKLNIFIVKIITIILRQETKESIWCPPIVPLVKNLFLILHYIKNQTKRFMILTSTRIDLQFIASNLQLTMVIPEIVLVPWENYQFFFF